MQSDLNRVFEKLSKDFSEIPALVVLSGDIVELLGNEVKSTNLCFYLSVRAIAEAFVFAFIGGRPLLCVPGSAAMNQEVVAAQVYKVKPLSDFY